LRLVFVKSARHVVHRRTSQWLTWIPQNHL